MLFFTLQLLDMSIMNIVRIVCEAPLLRMKFFHPSMMLVSTSYLPFHEGHLATGIITAVKSFMYLCWYIL
jgi:hypothetical protein